MRCYPFYTEWWLHILRELCRVYLAHERRVSENTVSSRIMHREFFFRIVQYLPSPPNKCPHHSYWPVPPVLAAQTFLPLTPSVAPTPGKKVMPSQPTLGLCFLGVITAVQRQSCAMYLEEPERVTVCFFAYSNASKDVEIFWCFIVPDCPNDFECNGWNFRVFKNKEHFWKGV